MVLSMFTDWQYDFSLTELIGTSVAVLGMTGSGKSNSAARLAEQSLSNGVPLCIMDIAGEYWGLKERFALVVAGQSAHVDITIETPDQAAALAHWSLSERVSVVFDISGYRPLKLRPVMVNAYLTAIFEASITLRRPYQIILEEAHNYVPQSTPTAASEIVTTIATEGRKNGLSLVVVSQRPARIDKDVLSQAGIRLLHRVFDTNDVKAYQSVIPESPAWVKDKAMALETGQAILVYPQKRICAIVNVLPRETYHGGATPGMDDVLAPTLTGLPTETLAALQSLLSKPITPVKPDGRVLELESRLAEQQTCIEQLQAQVDLLEHENALLSQLRVDMVAPGQIAVDTLHVARVVGGSVSPVKSPETKSAKPSPEPELDYRSPIATTRGINKQERDFSTMLSDIQNVAKSHRGILWYLLIHRQLEWFTAEDLARFLGYQKRTIMSNPPDLMLRYGLLERSIERYRSTRTHRYSVRGTHAQLQKRFPDLDTDDLMTRLLAACRG